MNDQTKNTTDSVQVCSILHVAHVGVRRVTLVIVHNGHQDVILMVSSFAYPFVRELLYREILYLHLLVHKCTLRSLGTVDWVATTRAT